MVDLATEIRWQDRFFRLPMERVLLSEQLGYDAVFTAEGFGSDGLVPLGYIAAHTTRLKLGTRILQVTGRPPSVAAMSLQTLNHLTGGNRVIAGLGSASPMAAEGLQGRPWGHPAARMRDYVAILRQALDGKPLDHRGVEWSAPYRGPGSIGLEPAAIGLAATAPIPILVAGSGPVMTQLAAEIGDGWMPPSFAPGMMPDLRPLLDRGFAQAGPGKNTTDFQIWCQVDVMVDDDVRAAMRPFKEYVVTWARMQRPFMIARGYQEMADRLEELIAAGETDDAEVRVAEGAPLLDGKRWEEALDAVPDEYIDDGWLVGPVARIRRRVGSWLDCGLTGLVVRYGPQMTHDAVEENLDVFRVIAEAAGKTPRSR